MNTQSKGVPQDDEQKKTQMMKTIGDHRVDIYKLKEKEDHLMKMIEMLQSLMPYATAWYMWKLALASRADPESRTSLEQEAKVKLARLLKALDELKNEVGQVKSGRDSKFGVDQVKLEVPSFKQIEPTLKPGSHELLGQHRAENESRRLPKPFVTEPSEHLVSKGPQVPQSPPTEPSDAIGASPEDETEPPLISESEAPESEPAPRLVRVPLRRFVREKRPPQQDPPIEKRMEQIKDQGPDMAEGSKSRSRIVREVIEIKRDGQPTEKIEVQPGMDKQQMKAVEDLIHRLDIERDNLQEEMDRIFGPLPQALSKPGAGGQPQKEKVSVPDVKKRDPETGEVTPKRPQTPAGRGRGPDDDSSHDILDLLKPEGRGRGRGMDTPDSIMPPWYQKSPGTGGPQGQGPPYTPPQYGMSPPISSPYNPPNGPYGGPNSPNQTGPYGQGSPQYGMNSPPYGPPGMGGSGYPQSGPESTPPFNTPFHPSFPGGGMSPDDIAKKIDQVLSKMDFLADQLNKHIEMEHSGNKSDSDEVDDALEGFSEQLKNLQEKVNRGVKRVEEAIEREVHRQQSP